MGRKQDMIDGYYMRIALDAARRGIGRTSPNPLVGCVIVRDGEVLSIGWHDHVGGPHAEASALAKLRENDISAEGATAYVTLEPCSHQGRTPPCAPALAAAGIVRCVVALDDPNPLVSGRGYKILEDAGIEVKRGVCRQESAWLNRGFLSLQIRHRPWLMLKTACSADGCMALQNGESQWITGEHAREIAHMLRSENDVILTGSGTVRYDNPSMNVRMCEGISPRIAVISSDLHVLDGDYKIVSPETLLLTNAPGENPDFPGTVVRVADEEGRISLEKALVELGNLGAARVMLEAGPTLLSAFINSGLVDEYQIFTAPKLMGNGRHITENIYFEHMRDITGIKIREVHRLGGDLWIEGVGACLPDWLKQ